VRNPNPALFYLYIQTARLIVGCVVVTVAAEGYSSQMLDHFVQEYIDITKKEGRADFRSIEYLF
jgi:hypothetical protein